MRWGLLGTCCILGLTIAAPAASQQCTKTSTYDVLGRLVVAKTSGGSNNNETHSICFDAAGNRSKYDSNSTGAIAGCVNAGSGSSTPNPTPTNSPPVMTNDSVSGRCYLTLTKNLTANDSDSEGHYPLSLIQIVSNSGNGSAIIISDSTVHVNFGPPGDISVFTYTVRDSLGATSTGRLTMSTSICSPGGGNEP